MSREPGPAAGPHDPAPADVRFTTRAAAWAFCLRTIDLRPLEDPPCREDGLIYTRPIAHEQIARRRGFGWNMELIGHRRPFAAFAAGALRNEDFSLVDVGCSGGIDSVWREFGERLAALGFDPSVEQVERLRKQETSSKIRYEAVFVGVPVSHPISVRRGGRTPFGRSPWSRLMVHRTAQILSDKSTTSTDAEIVAMNV